MINVANIEKFATHDGPGIRTTIFLQGCMLHCPWCANPETWSLKPVLMHDEKKCINCKSCVHACKQSAITFPFKWDETKCIRCHACEDTCLESAISFSCEQMSIDMIVKEALKDKDYFDASNGGVTISGGEPLYQLDNVLELFKALKKANLHVACETTGNYPLSHLKAVLPYVDLFLMDLKHVDKQKLFDVTGANLDLIKNNFDYLSMHAPDKVIVRMPVIPGFNDDACEDVIEFASNHHFKEVDLLPFHTMGKSKWHQIGRNFKYEDEKMMNKDDLKAYQGLSDHYQIKIKIGG